MDSIRSRLWAQICPQLEGPARRAAAVLHVCRGRTLEAVRDARHRLRTGRPRGGLPASYVHPPLPCSRACSKPAQRVHGLLYGYSLAYDEVRPRVETIAEVLGCGTSTVRNALGELRRAGLLLAHERSGKDGRRLANRYEVRVTSREAAPLRTSGAPSEPKRTRSEISNLGSKLERDSMRPTAPRLVRAPKGTPPPAVCSVAVSEEVLVKHVGPECLHKLRAHFPSEFGELRQVVALERGLELPGALRAACEQLVEARGSVERPAGYLRATLRGQRALAGGLELEVAELEALLEGFKQRGERERASRLRGEISKVQRRLAALRGVVVAGVPVPAVTPPPRAAKVDAHAQPVGEPVDLAESLKGAEHVLEVLRRPRSSTRG